MKHTPETISQFNRPHPAHRLSVTTAAAVVGTTGFGSGCKLPQSSRRCSTPSLTLAALLLSVLLQLMRLLPSPKLMLPNLTFKSVKLMLISNRPSWSSPYQLVLRLTAQCSSNTLPELLLLVVVLPLITLFSLSAGEILPHMATTGLLRIHGELPGALTAMSLSV
jgi:hypothetical protein